MGAKSLALARTWENQSLEIHGVKQVFGNCSYALPHFAKWGSCDVGGCSADLKEVKTHRNGTARQEIG
jgi:hypothetical protein